MMCASSATGGVLPSDANEQAAFHEKVNGVRYRTQAQQQREVERVVRPFQSMQLQQARKRPSTATTGAGVRASSSRPTSTEPPTMPMRMKTAAVHATAAYQSTTRPSTAASGSGSSASHKKAAASSTRPSTARTNAKSQQQRSSSTTRQRPTSASSAMSSSSVGDIHPLARAAPAAPAVPSWLAPAVHPPNRPNAPSQMSPTERQKMHEVDLTKHARKAHKATIQAYAKQYTNAAPWDLLESHSQVTIERHARPILVHPPKDRREAAVLKFVPIGHVVGIRPSVLQERDGNRGGDEAEDQGANRFIQSATPGQKEERHVKFTSAMRDQEQENDLTVHGYAHDSSRQPHPPSHQEREQEQARQSFHQIQSEWRPHGLFSQVDHPRLQREEQLEMEREQHQSSLESAPPKPLTSPPLQTLHMMHHAPQPYSEAFRAAAPSERATQPATNYELPEAAHQHNLNERTPTGSARPATMAPGSARVSPKSQQPQIHATAGVADVLTSPSPVRNHQPPQPQSFDQSAAATSASAAAATSSSSSSSHITPSKRVQRSGDLSSDILSDLARRQLEAEHEKQMKSYLSPTHHRAAKSLGAIGQSPTHGGGAGGGRKSVASPLFTPNPYTTGGGGDGDSARDASHQQSGLFYAPNTSRPADLPPADPRKGVIANTAASLYPSTESDPLRALAASLRGPRMKYEVAKKASTHVDDDGGVDVASPFVSPRKGTDSTGQEEDAFDPTHALLRCEIAARALEREKLERETRARWAERWQTTKKPTSTSGKAETEKPKEPATDAVPPSAAPTIGISPMPVAAMSSASAAAAAAAVAGTPISPPPSVVPVHRSTMSMPSLVGGRITEPAVVTGSKRNSLKGAFDARAIGATSNAPTTTATTTASSSFPSGVRVIAVGSQNATKVDAVRSVADQIFASVHDASYLSRSGREQSASPDPTTARRNEVVGVNVPSCVRAQPLSATETRQGAISRAQSALAAEPRAEYGVGVEGGLECVEDRTAPSGVAWYESAWVAVVDRSGKVGTGTSARFEISEAIAHELAAGRTELAEIADRLSAQKDVRSTNGFMGLITNDLLKRKECQMQGVIFAFAPFISPTNYWENNQVAAPETATTTNQ